MIHGTSSQGADGGRAVEDHVREELLRRYATIGPMTPWRRFKFETKRLVWVAVIGGAHLLKRLVDIVGGLILLVLLSPVFLTVAFLIKLESPGPVFFKQTRVGKWGRLFPMYKFRSMYIDAEARKAALMAQNEMAGGVLFKMKYDPRITRVGKYIRRGSVDELPQLWNVIKGDMSLVGPRPPVPQEVGEYTLADRRRLEAVPGITCIWQVSGRSEIPFKQQVELDVAYIESQSFWLDVRLLLKTVPAVLLGRGAY